MRNAARGDSLLSSVHSVWQESDHHIGSWLICVRCALSTLPASPSSGPSGHLLPEGEKNGPSLASCSSPPWWEGGLAEGLHGWGGAMVKTPNPPPITA